MQQLEDELRRYKSQAEQSEQKIRKLFETGNDADTLKEEVLNLESKNMELQSQVRELQAEIFSLNAKSPEVSEWISELFKFEHIYFTSIQKQILTTYTNLSRFCFLGTTQVLAPNVCAKEKSQS